MRLEDSFTVPVAPSVAWEALTDISRVAPCLPGAELVDVAGNEFKGLVHLKLGPISANYAGTAHFESVDEDNHRLVIVAQGRDRHGQGTASARVEAALVPDGNGTRVQMVQDINITGKAAQFGRGVLPDVSKQMMGRFADSLSKMLTADSTPRNGTAPSAASPPPAAEPINVAVIARGVARERAGALGMVLGLLVLLAILRRVRR